MTFNSAKNILTLIVLKRLTTYYKLRLYVQTFAAIQRNKPYSISFYFKFFFKISNFASKKAKHFDQKAIIYELLEMLEHFNVGAF